MQQDFFSLTPERVLDAVERSGHRTTGLCYALGSLENRVYEVELDDGRRVVCKFYRPGRWTRAAIAEEHQLLQALADNEIPVCAPLRFADGDTLHANAQGIFFAVFPRTGGRNPDELMPQHYEQLGRLLGRIHNVSSSLRLTQRQRIGPDTYGRDCLRLITQTASLSEALRRAYADTADAVIRVAEQRFAGVETFVVHGDCHRANLLLGRDGWFFIDFDDCGFAPAVQDLWLLLPARHPACPDEVDAMLRGYEQFRAFDRRTLRLIEPLRALRYMRYAAWVQSRWDDPSFPRAFPDFGTEVYWQNQLNDLREQLAVMQAEDQGTAY